MTIISLGNLKSSTKAALGSLVFGALVVLSLAALSVIPVWLASLAIVGLTVIVATIGYRIHVRRLEQKNIQITEINRVHLATIEALATAIDARDQIGVGHVRRTRIYAVRMGELLGLSENELDALRTGALLHDIGKLAIPDHILNKAGTLSDAEREKAKIYPAVGASILEKVDFGYEVVPTVRYHKERWDGRGYPKGLKGSDIPITARILSVADAYDTLRAARPYRPAIDRTKARQIIQDGSGTQFDPAVVNLLIKNLSFLEAAADEQGLSYSDSKPQETRDSAPQGQAYLKQIQLANREVFNLYELAREFGSSVTLSETLEMFAKKVGEFVPFDTCVLYLLDGQTGVAMASHVEGLNADLLALRRLKVGQGATGFALKSGKTVLNAAPDLDFTYSQTELLEQYSTMASVPLVADGALIGAVTIYSSDIKAYGEEHVRLLETISRIAADAIGKSVVHDEAKTHAHTDPMTGLPNARSLQKHFEKEVARASRGGTTFQILMLDLDGFKAVNDTFGHKVGDELLRQVGRVIQEQLRDYDFLARYGGDEFVAIVPDTGSEYVTDVCQRIEKAVTEFSLRIDDERAARVGVSIGASGYPRNGETFDQLIVSADKVMYERKVARKSRMAPPAPHVPTVAKAFAAVAADQAPQAPPPDDSFIIELDESHVMSSAMVN